MKQVVIFRYLWNHEALAEAFQNLGYEIEVNPSNKDLEKYKPDEILCCIANLHTEIKKPFTMLGLKQKLNAKHAPLIFWNRDGPSHMGDKFGWSSILNFWIFTQLILCKTPDILLMKWYIFRTLLGIQNII